MDTARKRVADADWIAIKRNLFDGCLTALGDAQNFPFHRDQSGHVTACRLHSSQALAVSVFGAISALESRDLVMNALMDTWKAPPGEKWVLTPEKIGPAVLREPRPTQIDYVAESDSALVLFECKFTESDGGACSQVKPLAKGARAGEVQCDGNYRIDPIFSHKTDHRCTLTSKGIRYWEYVPSVLAVDPNVDHTPCPFRGGWFQWMRNLVAAAAMAGSKSPITAIVYPEGPFPIAAKLRSQNWKEFVALASGGRVSLQIISYQMLMRTAVAAATGRDKHVLLSLQQWLDDRIARVAETLPEPRDGKHDE